ncbi:transcription elongation factor A N-terminal and central domain-containing protein isoform X2 [Sceloporus undulatus]|uniref:transcription elongation factor A N-terminal and central domain-containing protein isoform X2 n=1 Tax=Sceloporus undulatus TaxID=8520 RepID=UPI001C4DBF9E|nr:transcription elongation factor A N-terminal and central domain-containing protein isoform X2 [Sceloporus undulatus]
MRPGAREMLDDPGSEMSNTKVLMTRADSIEKLLSERKYQDIGIHLAYLETVDMTIDDLQETDVAKAVFRIFKTCPSVLLKNKAKHLLSKWKAVYKKHYSPSRQFKCASFDNANEDSGHLQVVSEDVNTSENLNQHDKMCSASSSSCLTSENPSNDGGSHVQKDNAAQPALLGCTSSVSETGQRQDLTMAVRCKCTQLLYEALTVSSTSNEENEKHHKIAEEIEEHVFALYASNDRKYKNCIRSKVSNLKNPKNSHLKHNLCSGVLSPKRFADMSAMEMAHDELKQLRASYTESALREHQLPQRISGTPTNKIKCRRCENFDCTVTVIARGALFLPSWVRNTNPDEQMMTYVICNECGEQWYHSRWNCL